MFLFHQKDNVLLTPFIFIKDLFSLIIPPYTLGAKNTASKNSYSSFNWPNLLPIKSG